jgi:hypothetical protein
VLEAIVAANRLPVVALISQQHWTKHTDPHHSYLYKEPPPTMSIKSFSLGMEPKNKDKNKGEKRKNHKNRIEKREKTIKTET